jgi:hypothetical protein
MSSYFTRARVKGDEQCKDYKLAIMEDNHFGLHKYGVKIDGYTKVFREDECEFENK